MIYNDVDYSYSVTIELDDTKVFMSPLPYQQQQHTHLPTYSHVTAYSLDR